jgi:flavodoxin
MKILVSYFSQTGNTQKIGEAIFNEISKTNETELKKLEETSSQNLSNYDVIFLGSPIHAGGLAAQAKTFMESLPENPSFKIAAFVTHSAFAYEKQNFEKGIQSLYDISKSKNISFLGCFDCQGKLTPMLHDMVKKARNMSDEEWAERMAKADKHPDAEDEMKAKDFAKDVLSKL